MKGRDFYIRSGQGLRGQKGAPREIRVQNLSIKRKTENNILVFLLTAAEEKQ